MLPLLVFVVVIHSVSAVCCPPGGTWSEWTANLTSCYDYCGGVGNMTRTRTCESIEQGCPCIGDESETVSCETYPCISPRNHTCAPGKTLQVLGGAFQCAIPGTTVTTVTLPPSTNCSCRPTGGMWGEWVDNGACSDTCGGCGRINRTRTCLTALYGTNCTASSTVLQTCNRTPCVGRTSECCAGTVKTALSVGTVCLDTIATPSVGKANCCPSSTGLWNQWTSWTTCSATCGLCGARTRSRTCASQTYGYNCTGNFVETKRCGGVSCSGSVCCMGSLVKAYDGADLCLETKPLLSFTGTWSSYTPITGRTCNDTCGAYGSVYSSRLCLPVGSTCTGSFFGYAPCNFSICTYPRQSCATGYKKVIVGSDFVCSASTV